MDEIKNNKFSSKIRQSLRLRRSLLAAGAGFANSLVILLAWIMGYVFIDEYLLVGYFILSSVGYLIFPLLIYFKYNLKFKDPSLTQVQISWQLIMLTLCMYSAPQLRVLLVTNYLLILIFSIFRLHPRQMPYLAAGLAFSYFAVILAQFHFSPITIDWNYEFLISLVFLLALVVVNLLAMEIAGLRFALKKRNEYLAIMTEKNKQLAITDSLTGLSNRRQIMRDLSRQKSLGDRGKYNFSIVFVDLDFFKQVNDTYGHATGDKVLQEVAQTLKGSVRDVDFVARLGGEEFILVLVQVDYAASLSLAERVRANLAEQVFTAATQEQQEFKLTASFGVASFRVDESVADLIDRADKAVYVAKNSGRNQVIGEEELPEGELIIQNNELAAQTS